MLSRAVLWHRTLRGLAGLVRPVKQAQTPMLIRSSVGCKDALKHLTAALITTIALAAKPDLT